MHQGFVNSLARYGTAFTLTTVTYMYMYILFVFLFWRGRVAYTPYSRICHMCDFLFVCLFVYVVFYTILKKMSQMRIFFGLFVYLCSVLHHTLEYVTHAMMASIAIVRKPGIALWETDMATSTLFALVLYSTPPEWISSGSGLLT